MRTNLYAGATVLAVFALAGCELIFPIETAEDLANALKRRGVDYSTTEPIDTTEIPRVRIDEGLSLRGENLRIDILRIEDRDTFQIMNFAGALTNRIGGLLAEDADKPPETYARSPFVVLIFEEPEEGKALDALREILPQEEAQ